MDLTTMLPILLLSSGRSSNMMMPLLLMMMMSGNNNGGTSSNNPLAQAFTPQALSIAMLPAIGTLGKYMIGGVGALMASKFMNPTRRRRRSSRPRTIVINRSNRRFYR